MARTDALSVNVGDPTRASDFNKLARNSDYLYDGLGKQHDLTNLTTANGRHYARNGNTMRLELTTGQEYSLAGSLSGGHLRVLLANSATDTLLPSSGYWRDLVVGREGTGNVLHIGEGFAGTVVSGSQFGDGTVAGGYKIRLDASTTWTFKPFSDGGVDGMLVKKSNVAFADLDKSSADRFWNFSESSGPSDLDF